MLRHAKVKTEYKDDLKKKLLYFSNVDTLELTSVKWSSIRFQRNNQTCRMLISICQLIVEGMLITTDKGDYRLALFVDGQRMCRLYEKFILEYGACEDEAGGVQISTDLSPIERRVGLACKIAKWMTGYKTLQYA